MAQAQPQKTDTQAAPPPPVSAEATERESRMAANKVTREKAKAIFEAFKSAEVGLNPYPASLLAAHAYSTVDGIEKKTQAELVTWANEFKRLNPVPWHSLKSGNLMGFSFGLRRSNIEGMTANEYAELATVIRG